MTYLFAANDRTNGRIEKQICIENLTLLHMTYDLPLCRKWLLNIWSAEKQKYEYYSSFKILNNMHLLTPALSSKGILLRGAFRAGEGEVWIKDLGFCAQHEISLGW